MDTPAETDKSCVEGIISLLGGLTSYKGKNLLLKKANSFFYKKPPFFEGMFQTGK